MPSADSVTSESITDVQAFIHDYLIPALPYSLTLARRCEFHNHHKADTPGAELRIFRCVAQSEPRQPIWLVAHIDLTVAGQTQVWLYGSWESQYANDTDPEDAVRQSKDFSSYQALFNALFRHIQQYHIPRLSRSPPEQWLRLKEQGKLLSVPFSRSQLLFGSIAQSLWQFLYGYQAGSNDPVGRHDNGYLKYIVSRPVEDEVIELPAGLRFKVMGDEDLQIMIDRTVIPRTLETVRTLTNMGVYEGEKVVAWGHLGKDGSVSSLHSEPEWRGQGLAVAVARRLMQEQSKTFREFEQGTILASADVSKTNLPSRRVLEKLGGKPMWAVAWISLELGEQ